MYPLETDNSPSIFRGELLFFQGGPIVFITQMTGFFRISQHQKGVLKQKANIEMTGWVLVNFRVSIGPVLLMVQKSGDHHLGCIKPWKSWEKLPINCCKISEPSTV